MLAGGGYGKTTALRQLSRGGRTVWLALTPADRDTEVLAAHIEAALGAEPESRGQPIGAADRRGLAEGRAAALCARFDADPEPTMLILDDVDVVRAGDPARDFLGALCLQAPASLHIVLGGRSLPPLDIGWARSRGELLELSAPDLAFTREESEALLSSRLGPEAAALARDCWALTSGWAAALQLIADQLQRVDPPRWRESLAGLAANARPWREFAQDLLAQETGTAAAVLRVAAVAPVLDAELLAGLDTPEPAEQLESLQTRGLLVATGEAGGRNLSPVLAEAVAERLPEAEAGVLRERVAGWLEGAGRLAEAFECRLGGPADATRALLRRHGRELIAAGSAARVARALALLGTGGEIELERLRGEALVSSGDWDGALELLQAVRRREGAEVQPATAWRLGALLYLRGENEAAREVLSGAQREAATGSEDAFVSAWLASALWGEGELEASERSAEVALRQAHDSGDPAARGAAHVAVALAAASRGDRAANARHHRLALQAAREAADTVQIARIHANLSSKAVEDGDYPRAVAEADAALSAGAGHDLFSALAMSNKAEALIRLGELEEARAMVVAAAEMLTGLGSLVAATPYTILGMLDTERGDLTRARVSLERAWRLAEQASDVHASVLALVGLARATGPDDPDGARRYAREAMARATSLERAPALCAGSWVELAAGDRAKAAELAIAAEGQARATEDVPSLARALELQGAAAEPPDEGLLEAAIELWRSVSDPIAELRTRLLLADVRRDSAAARQLRTELAARGVSPEAGLAEVSDREHGQRAAIEITTLGRFGVRRATGAVALGEWQSRKARDLLKLLAARRGHPVTRDAAAEALWPEERPDALANRLSVALSTARKVLDPARAQAPDHFIAAGEGALALRIEHVRLDVTVFLEAAREGVALSRQEQWGAAEARLLEAEALYTGDFLEEDLYEDWAVDCREEARSAALEVSRVLARAAARRGDDEEGGRHLRRLLERDPYDADAWTALLGSQLRLRRYGEARRLYAIYARRMAELKISPVPLAQVVDRRP